MTFNMPSIVGAQAPGLLTDRIIFAFNRVVAERCITGDALRDRWRRWYDLLELFRKATKPCAAG